MEKELEIKTMQIRPCPCCDSMPWYDIKMKPGIPSGDMGWEATIKCTNRKCGVQIIKWAYKKEWVLETIVNAWNMRKGKEYNGNNYGRD